MLFPHHLCSISNALFNNLRDFPLLPLVTLFFKHQRIQQVIRIHGLMNDLISGEGFQGTFKQYVEELNSQPGQFYSTSVSILLVCIVWITV